jgi:TRAP-type C4-dicarboxylate transport system substrate-binding protein
MLDHVTTTRRTIVRAALAAPALVTLGGLGSARAATTLKLSHQFPGGTIDEGDFRDRMCRKFAAEVEKRTSGALAVQVYPGSSLMKTNNQFSAMRKGALDMSLWPLAYASGELPETSIGLMPALVTSYEQAGAWKNAAIGKRLTQVMESKGLVFVSWVWQAGDAASRSQPMVVPADAKGMKIRGGSREVDLLMKAAGAATLNIPSNEAYIAMQTGACDAVITSATSMISFRLQELSKNLTSGRGRFYWFMLEPILMSKTIFDGLPKDQRDAIMAVGAEMEAFGLAGAKADDEALETVFTKAGAKVETLDEAGLRQWRDLARDHVWKEFAARSSTCAELLKLAEAVA